MPTLLEDKEAIRELFYRYCYGTDTGDTETWVGVFTDDCLWDGGPFGVLNGKDAMRAFHKQGADQAKTMRHLTLNTLINVSGDQAQALSYVAVLGPGEKTMNIFFVGFYEDALVRQGGRWLIKSRKLRPDSSDLKLPV